VNFISWGWEKLSILAQMVFHFQTLSLDFMRR